MAHSKGPWTHCPMKGTPGHCFAAQVWDSEGLSLAVIDSRYGEEKATANAKIIATAPEMLEVLETIENDANQVPEWLWERIKTVIKKATE